MSSKILKNNSPVDTLDCRIKILCESENIDGKELAGLIGISATYLTDIRHGTKVKGNPLKFWKGIAKKFPMWESFLRGESSVPPPKEIGRRHDISLADVARHTSASGAMPNNHPQSLDNNSLHGELDFVLNCKRQPVIDFLRSTISGLATMVREEKSVLDEMNENIKKLLKEKVFPPGDAETQESPEAGAALP